MRPLLHFLLLCFCPAMLLSGGDAPKEPLPFLSPIFGDNMVLQAGKPNVFWGWTTPGREVRVTIEGRSALAVAGPDGRWQARIEVPPVGRTCEVRVDGSEHRVLHHVIVGEVWLCGGQSNMRFPLEASQDGPKEVAAANLPQVRLFVVKPRPAYAPASTVTGAWAVCSPASVAADGGFSAVGYYFGRKVSREAGVPVGLIEDCLGGTPVESWMDPATLSSTEDFKAPMAEVLRLHEKRAPEYGNYLMHWLDEYDAGTRAGTWAESSLDDHDWRQAPLAGAFEALGLSDVPAVCWFRREFTLPTPLPQGPLTLYLGEVEKMDTAYVNGHWVGASSWVENPRIYSVPQNLLKAGRNLLALRIFKVKSKTGFLTPPETVRLVLPTGGILPLAGDWRCKVSVDARPPHPLPLGYENYPIMPAVLFNGMITPISPLALRGALWYQGEANTSRAHQYRRLLPAMIRDWRAAFEQGDFPFLIVGLPRYQARRETPGDDEWAELREAQAMTAASVTNCDLVVTIDTGEANNIHPKEKRPVGERLAAAALTRVYGRQLAFQGPVFRSMQREGSALRIRFDHADGGLMARGESLAEFSVAGSDRRWHWAKAAIENDSVVVSCPEVTDPVAVRYAWQGNPLATLFNAAGLPAEPFRTDTWPGNTDHRNPW